MLIAFVPVIHQGYVDLFKKYPGELGILGSDVIAKYTSIARDLRAMNPGAMKKVIESMRHFDRVRIITAFDLTDLAKSNAPIVMPDDEVAQKIIAEYGFQNVTLESIFLRWGFMPTTRENVVAPHRIISRGAFEKEMMGVAMNEAQKSADWWRQVGTVIVQDGEIIAHGHNHHLPTDYHLSLFGDPRTNFNAGERIDLSTAIHSEASVIASCARRGISLDGASAFVTTFPCPNCARLLAESGVKTVYYSKGYSLLDAEAVLNGFNVNIVLVQLDEALT